MVGGKLNDIKETASDAVEIMREIGTPGVQETFDKIREIAIIGKEIMEVMQTPEWQRNLENIRLISQNFNQASERMERTAKELKETGIIDDTKELVKVVKEKIGSFGGGDDVKGGQNITGQDLRELTVAVKEMFESIKDLSREVKDTIAESRRSGTIQNIKQTESAIRDTFSDLR